MYICINIITLGLQESCVLCVYILTSAFSTWSRQVIYKLLGFTAAMIALPIGMYFLTVDSIFKGKSSSWIVHFYPVPSINVIVISWTSMYVVTSFRLRFSLLARRHIFVLCFTNEPTPANSPILPTSDLSISPLPLFYVHEQTLNLNPPTQETQHSEASPPPSPPTRFWSRTSSWRGRRTRARG